MSLELFENIEKLSESLYINDSIEPLSDVDEFSEINDIHDSKESTESLSSRIEMMEIMTDFEMAEGIADYLESIEEFRLENWQKLSLSEREELLNRVEHTIAAIEHRPALRVELQQMQPRHLGYQSASENKIVLNSLYVGSNDAGMHREVLDTIVHEGRHAYQHYNVDVKLIHESGSEVETWRENFYDPEYQYYHSGTQKILIPYNDGSIHDVDYRLYYYQPVEIDARNFASEVLSRLEERGVVTPSIHK